MSSSHLNAVPRADACRANPRRSTSRASAISTSTVVMVRTIRAIGRPVRREHPEQRRAEMTATIGLDIGGTKMLGVLLDVNGAVLREERLASPHTGLDALVATGAAIVE